MLPASHTIQGVRAILRHEARAPRWALLVAGCPSTAVVLTLQSRAVPRRFEGAKTVARMREKRDARR
jgi:hypothetical protein